MEIKKMQVDPHNDRMGSKPRTDPVVFTQNNPDPENNLSVLNRFWKSLQRMGLDDIFVRVGIGVVSVALIGIVVWLMSSANLTPGKPVSASFGIPTLNATNMPTLVPAASMDAVMPVSYLGGVPRLAMIHTTIPDRPRDELSTYTVQDGDTVIAIADKFGLKPQSIFFANYDILIDDPHQLKAGQVLTILPTDGVIYTWNAGDGLNGVSSFYNVKPEDIINYPLNKLSMDTIGDLSHPNIEAGTKLIIPGGTREYVTWSAPRITRTDPAVAKVLGPGYCGSVSDGPVGTGAFQWPTDNHTLSGYDYSPETNHYGIDITGQLGNPVRAADNGVVVYSGWNDWGYGNVIVIDHGDGWQTLYAHLSAIYVGCSAGVGQGATIGLIGTTGNSSGPHLHFEIMSDAGGKVNPWDFLPK
jgi:murein DD-endopeptidase MepM/ murein hydrolase activator NlpD